MKAHGAPSSVSHRRRPGASTSATPAPRCSTGSSRVRRAAPSSCVSTTPTSNGRRPSTPTRSRRISRWLGIEPDLVRRQSDRTAAYEAAAEKLKAPGRLYPAYETPDELDRGASASRRSAARRLRPRRAEADRRRSRRARSRRPQAALALSTGRRDRPLGRHRARRDPHRLRVAVRPGPPARGRRPTSTRCPRSSTTSTSA